jgi:hypothetical protein
MPSYPNFFYYPDNWNLQLVRIIGVSLYLKILTYSVILFLKVIVPLMKIHHLQFLSRFSHI